MYSSFSGVRWLFGVGGEVMVWKCRGNERVSGEMWKERREGGERGTKEASEWEENGGPSPLSLF